MELGCAQIEDISVENPYTKHLGCINFITIIVVLYAQ